MRITGENLIDEQLKILKQEISEKIISIKEENESSIKDLKLKKKYFIKKNDFGLVLEIRSYRRSKTDLKQLLKNANSRTKHTYGDLFITTKLKLKKLLECKKNPNKIKCKNCNAINYNRENNNKCWLCQELFEKDEIKRAFVLKYRYRNINGEARDYTSKELTFANDFASKHSEDLLQPTRWNNVEKKEEINPDFTKRYGNPYQDQPEDKTLPEVDGYEWIDDVEDADVVQNLEEIKDRVK